MILVSLVAAIRSLRKSKSLLTKLEKSKKAKREKPQDGKTGEAYMFEDVAGGNSEPQSVWNGTDSMICEFCHQCWEPGDSDDMYLRNLLSFTGLAEDEQEEIIRRESEGEMTISEIKQMYPDAVEEYNNEYISNEMSEFDPDYYINRFEEQS